MTRVALAAVLLSVASLTVLAQSSSGPAKTILAGRVVADDTGDPVRNVRIAIPKGQLGSPTALTDEDGRFTLELNERPSLVQALKTGYAPSTVAPTRDQPLEIRLR